MTQTEKVSFLSSARELVPRVSAAADRIDSERRLPEELANEMIDRGFFRLLMPRSLGGFEIDLLDYLQIVQTFAEADGSVGWCLNQNTVLSSTAATMTEDLVREIWSDPRAVLANGPIISAKAVPVEGGYRLTGRWNFSSGCQHATWMIAATPADPSDGNLDPRKAHREGLTMLVPKEQVEFVDVWQVGGLRGTGSFTFQVQDLFVPANRVYDSDDKPRVDGPLYAITTNLLFPAGFACVALGVARGAVDSAIEMAGGKKAQFEENLLRDKPTIQRSIGRAEALWGSARALLFQSAERVWRSACETRSLTLEDRIRLRVAATHAIRTAADVVDIAYEVCGSSSIFQYNPIQRRFQDVHTITQQIQGRMAHYETAGQFFLGMDPKGLFY